MFEGRVLPITLIEKLGHAFLKQRIPYKIEKETLIAKIHGHPIVIEHDTDAKMYRIIVLTNIDLKQAKSSLILGLLNKNFSLLDAKIASDPEDYLSVVSEIPENCLTNNDVKLVLEKVNKLIYYTENVVRAIARKGGKER